MKVSIITATYNSAKALNSCIESVNNQSYNNIEHIFVDGSSTDNTLDIINSLSKRTKIVFSEKDEGIYDALNRGVNLSTGDIIGFVHSDDLLAHSQIIEDLVNVFVATNADGVYGDLNYVNKLDLNKIVRKWKGKTFKPKLLSKGWMPAHPTLFLKKEVYIIHGLFDISYKIAADFDFILRIFTDSTLNFFYYPHVISIMRLGGASNKNFSNIVKKSREDYRALKYNNQPFAFKALLYKNFSKLSQFVNRR